MSKRTTWFLYSIVFALGAFRHIEALWLVILLYSLKTLDQKLQGCIVIIGGLASIGTLMKSMQTIAIELGPSDLAKPLRSVLDFIAYKSEYDYIVATLSVLFIIISVAFAIIGCISKNET